MKKIVFVFIIALSSTLITQAQKKEKKNKDNLLVKLQEGAKPKIIVDGKVFDFPLELIDQSKVASMMVVKGKEAIKKYDAPNGIVIIITKDSDVLSVTSVKIPDDKKIGGKNGPKVIIDGKIADQKTLKSLKPNMIDEMEVIKGKNAIKKYNAPNGVIIITTKKK